MSQGTRRLAAIMFTDMVGYTALGQRNEALSLALVDEQRKLIRPILLGHNGREVKTIGDAFLVEFPNALDAVKSAYEIQRSAKEFNVTIPEDSRVHLRIGVHLGDVVESQGDISGDAVNVASRIEPLSEDGGVCITRQVYDQVQNKMELPLVSIGIRQLKNVSTALEIFKMVMPWERQISLSEQASIPSRDRIAVLPFRNMSPDPNDEYFAEGITEEIISTVSGIRGLSVISRTSVMGYKGTTKKVGEIGKELGVGSILEGSFRKAGSKIRVTTQLIDVEGDRHLWAQNYDRELDDVFAVQSDIAKQVADSLKVKIISREMDRIDKRPTVSTAAYTLYLKGRQHWNKRGLEDLKKAAEYFELATHEDSKFALGFVGLADCYELFAYSFGLDAASNHDRARAMVVKALQLDPELAEAHASLGIILSDGYDQRGAEVELKKAIELKPSYATAHQWYYFVLWFTRRQDQALVEIRRAVELDPLSQIIRLNYAGYIGQESKDWNRAIEETKRGLELNPESGVAHLQLLYSYGKAKRLDDMRAESKVVIQLMKDAFPRVEASLMLIMSWLEEDKERVAEWLREVESGRLEEGLQDQFDIAGYHFYLGQNDLGFECMEKAYAKRVPTIPSIQVDDRFDRIRTDPRYFDLLKRLGLE